MQKGDGLLVLVAIVAVVAVLVVGMTAGKYEGKEIVRKEAVKAGVAEWIPGDNGQPEFRWKVPK